MTKTTTNKAGERIPDRLYFKIGDVANLVDVKPYVLRYWESEFPILSPEKKSSGQRVYRRSDVETLLMIKHLLYTERYSLEGARRRIRDLRKDGLLKDFKEKAVVASGAELDGGKLEAPHATAQGLTIETPADVILRIREDARVMLELARRPMSEIFRI